MVIFQRLLFLFSFSTDDENYDKCSSDQTFRGAHEGACWRGRGKGGVRDKDRGWGQGTKEEVGCFGIIESP